MVIIDKTAWQIDGGIPEDLEACYDEYLRVIAKDKYGIDFNGEELEKIYKKYREFENFYGVGKTRIWVSDPTRISEFFGKGRV